MRNLSIDHLKIRVTLIRVHVQTHSQVFYAPVSMAGVTAAQPKQRAAYIPTVISTHMQYVVSRLDDIEVLWSCTVPATAAVRRVL